MIKHLENSDNFIELTKERTIVDFYADWCGPCKMMGLVLEELDAKEDLNILKVNTDKHPELSTKMGVMSIPTLFVIENNKEIKKHIGYMSKEELSKFIE